MSFNFTLFFSALGLAFILEALPSVLFPDFMLEQMHRICHSGTRSMRIVGLISLTVGLIILALALRP